MNPRLKKRLSQNFLRDPNIARRIVAEAAITPSDNVLEIGCGDGALTSWIVKTGCSYTGIEVDPEWFNRLTELVGDHPNVELLNIDFMKWQAPGTNSQLKVVGNLPYHISSQILFRLMDLHYCVRSATLMLQKEVVERIVSPPGSKAYGILSVFCQYYADCKRLFDVSPSAFVPRPTVHSSILQLEFHSKLKAVGSELLFKKLVKQSFNQRRKMLRNSIAGLVGKRSVTINLDLRPEHLSVDDFVQLSQELEAEQ